MAGPDHSALASEAGGLSERELPAIDVIIEKAVEFGTLDLDR
jgi:hypothetical protein